jgi:hypothetical protein
MHSLPNLGGGSRAFYGWASLNKNHLDRVGYGHFRTDTWKTFVIEFMQLCTIGHFGAGGSMLWSLIWAIFADFRRKYCHFSWNPMCTIVQLWKVGCLHKGCSLVHVRKVRVTNSMPLVILPQGFLQFGLCPGAWCSGIVSVCGVVGKVTRLGEFSPNEQLCALGSFF